MPAFDWREVIAAFKFPPTTTSTSFVLRRSYDDFANLQGIDELARKMVEKKKDIAYLNVYLLVKLKLILPVATTSVERVFSSMNFVKDKLYNWMSDDRLNSYLMAYIEYDVFDKVGDEAIMQYFQEMKYRRMILY
ncbi:hypothetical protein Cni_G22430 [Canna indica]|uniref:HAT C-terminal dimerisation domain-containing protein n=1 Tax=Canna indica TaxID=4628 RepID=A0AAQ3KU64_9LILI|nr:hypothetical protein Cni_G22430 [Canna indica]